MSQFQGPPPTITGVQSLNNSLYVTWQSDPYSMSTDATLLVINTTTNIMSSILLDNAGIMAEEYTVTGLTNGNVYAVLFSILDASGNTHNSNTQTGVPSDVPQPPTIVSYALQGPSYTTLSVVVTLGNNGGSDITGLVFRILDDTSNNPIVTSQQFAVLSNNTYTLTNLIANQEYIISCQALNSTGYSNVSNSINFINNNSITGAPTLATISSGADSLALLNVSGNNTSPTPVTSFDIFDNGVFITTLYPTQPFTGVGQYNTTLTLGGLTNGTAYSLTVRAVNSTGSSLASNIQTVVPALKLAFSNAVVTFPSATTIQVNWDDNAATFISVGETTVGFTGANIPSNTSVTVSNSVTQATYVLPSSSLVAGQSYSVTINGYCVVPSTLYPSKWIIPVLTVIPDVTNNAYSAIEVTTSRVYATVPGQVSNITYTSDIVDASGSIPASGQLQFSWTAANNNGSPILTYFCQLYTVSNGQRTPIQTPISTSATNCLFIGLDINLFYAIGIVAANSAGRGLPTYYPASANIGIQITNSPDPVTNLVGTQIGQDASNNYLGELSWNYTGPGTGYTDASFNIYSIVGGNQVPLVGSPVRYIPGTSSYTFGVNLGPNANVSKQYLVTVTATSQTTQSTSIGVYVIITSGNAPIISDVFVTPLPNSTNYQLSFKITNNTNLAMIPNSIVSLVMPDPLSLIAVINPILNDYDVTFVDTSISKSFVYQHSLGYKAISNDYVLITASNGYGTAVYSINWGTSTPV